MRSRARFLTGFDVFYLELDLTTLVRILLDGVADVESALRFDVTRLRALAEGYAVHHFARLIVHQLQFDVFLFASYDFACSVIIHMVRAENRLFILRPEGIELFQVVEELGCDVLEVYLRINVYHRRCLFGQDVMGYKFTADVCSGKM